jgi:hydrogenase maturation protein HypF
MIRDLLIGYGNTLRRDDGAGPAVVAAVSSRAQVGSPFAHLRTLVAHQLLPELADPIADAERVIFVDARVTDPAAGVTVEPIAPADLATARFDGHVASPAALLTLARVVFGRAPREAWLVTLPGVDFDLGEGLSALTEAAVATASDRIVDMLARDDVAPSQRIALRLLVTGRVQGVGFRPTVARLAAASGLSGWVKNTVEGVVIHLEGPREDVIRYRDRLEQDAPSASRVDQILETHADLEHTTGFSILRSESRAGPDSDASVVVEITPDLATCATCQAEFDDPASRRSGFALNGCADCGPRFSMMTGTVFDRDRTAMAGFIMCDACRSEHEDASDRRFHAQNTSCPACGPRVWVEGPNSMGPSRARDWPDDRPAIERAALLVRSGAVLAVKGIGGFHLVCDATNEAAIRALRDRKHRPRKPLAVMFNGLGQVNAFACTDQTEREALAGPSAPIVLLQRREGTALASGIAPGLDSVGAMLAYAPLHRSLIQLTGVPIVATSANASDEPMPVDIETARAELADIADAFLLHDRPIVRHADDGVVRSIGGRVVPVRIGRGSSPVRLSLPRDLPPTLATGGHLKAAVALARGRDIFLGQHIGNLDTAALRRRYRDNVADLTGLLRVRPEFIACDLHPDYFSTSFADASGLPVLRVQHHHAHALSCLAEHGATGPALAVVWDGTGHGPDGSIWGGEFLLVDGASYRRVGSLWPFRLVGGDRAARDASQVAACAAIEAGLQPERVARLDPSRRRVIEIAARSSRASTLTTSAGRLFDAWAATLGLCARSSYEGEAAVLLESAADRHETGVLPFEVVVDEEADPSLLRIDWRAGLAETVSLREAGTEASILSARFHNALARCTLEVARRVGVDTVVLSGGCFQNRALSERAQIGLAREGFRVLTHHRVPPGDGGLAVGQAWAVALQGA